jgi:XTP/dITP diphosphohydrolase
MKKIFLINTSNRQKLHELKVLFNKYGIEVNASNIDIKEIDADPLIVILHKASQLDDNIIVEDVSLEVESSNIGVNIRWRLDKLKELKGYKAKFIVMLAVKQGNKVKIYKGEVAGESNRISRTSVEALVMVRFLSQPGK